MSSEIIFAAIGSSALFSFITFLIQRHDTKRDDAYVKKADLKPIKDACMAIIQDRLEWQMTNYIARGEVTPNQFKATSTLMSAYEGCGGDDFIHALWEQFKELPIR